MDEAHPHYEGLSVVLKVYLFKRYSHLKDTLIATSRLVFDQKLRSMAQPSWHIKLAIMDSLFSLDRIHLSFAQISLGKVYHMTTANFKGAGKCKSYHLLKRRRTRISANSPSGYHNPHFIKGVET